VADSSFEYVLFDLGGVLVELSGVGSMMDLAAIDSDDEVWRRWLSSPWVRRFERGWCSIDDFAAGMVEEWALPIGPDDFVVLFRSWPRGLFDGAQALVGAVGERVTVGALSNTNELHWTDQRDQWGLGAMFEMHFLSHELGLVKPDRQLFDHVVAALDTEPERVLFLDDNALNVDGARAAGLVACHVRGVDQARDALASHSVLDR